MTNREKEVLRLIKENPLISQQECAERMGISRSAAAGHIMNLTAKGYIAGKGYIINEEPYAVVIGGSNMDILGKPADRFVSRDSNPGTVSLSPGGVGRNIAENVARMGTPVKLLTVVGKDLYGEQLLDSCRSAGIDMNYGKISRNSGTSVYLSILDGQGDMISAVSDMSLMEELDREYLEKNRSVINGSSLIILDANLPDSLLEYVMELSGDRTIFADPVSTAKAVRFKPFLRNIHTIKPNILEAEILTDTKIRTAGEGEKAAGILLEKGVERVFLSMGESGVLYRDRKKTILHKSEKVLPVNTTGAGDAYSAALVCAWMKGFSPEKTLSFAAAASKLTLLSRDTISRDISLNKLENMIKGENP